MTSTTQDDAVLTSVPNGAARKAIRRLTLKEHAIDFTCRVLRRLVDFRAYWLLKMEPADIPGSFKQEKSPLEARMIQGSDLRKLAGLHRDLGKHFIERSIRKGDWCHAYFDGDQLASYGWCSTQPTRVADNFRFEFPDDYFYMHRGFTLPEYRGQRLNAHGMVEAVQLGATRGLRGLVGVVEVQNVHSLRSSKRLGQQRVGRIFTYRLFGRRFVLRTPGSRRHGCHIIPR